MKVVQVIDTLFIGGAETLVKDYLMYFPKSIECSIICLGRKLGTQYEEILLEQGVKIYWLAEMIKNYNQHSFFYRLWLFQQCLNEINPDIIHGHLSAIRYLAFANTQKAKLFYTIHSDVEIIAKRITLFDISMKWCLKRKGLVAIALHPHMKDIVNQRYHIKTTVYIKNGINTQQFMYPSVSREKLFECLGISGDYELIIGNVGRLSKVKNQTFLIEILKEIREKEINAALLIVGQGAEKSNLEEMAKKLKISDHLYLLGIRHDISELYHIFDIFCMPSRWEGFPITLIEAQAAGRKCLVSTAIDSEVKILDTTIFASISESAAEWANRILELNKQKVIYKEEKVMEFDIHKIIMDLLKLYLS